MDNHDALYMEPNLSLTFNQSTEGSVQNASPSDHQKNPSYVLSPIQSLSHFDHDSIPIALNLNISTKDKDLTPDETILGINHSYSARKIWMNSCLKNNQHYALLQDLYPHLMEEFRRLTKCNQRQPTMKQISSIFLRKGGKCEYSDNMLLILIQALYKSTVINIADHTYYSMQNSIYDIIIDYLRVQHIASSSFDKFFGYFRSICSIIKDLSHIYDNKDNDVLVGLFFVRDECEQVLQSQPIGTFILRFASQQNGLAVTFKNKHSKIQHVLLTRITNELYQVGKSDKQLLLYQLLRPWDDLKFLYTVNKLIDKNYLF